MRGFGILGCHIYMLRGIHGPLWSREPGCMLTEECGLPEEAASTSCPTALSRG